MLCSGRRSLHQFDNPEEETLPLIYNYTPVYAANFTGYQQIYFFWMSHRYTSLHRDYFHRAEDRCVANAFSFIIKLLIRVNIWPFQRQSPLHCNIWMDSWGSHTVQAGLSVRLFSPVFNYEWERWRLWLLYELSYWEILEILKEFTL